MNTNIGIRSSNVNKGEMCMEKSYLRINTYSVETVLNLARTINWHPLSRKKAKLQSNVLI